VFKAKVKNKKVLAILYLFFLLFSITTQRVHVYSETDFYLPLNLKTDYPVLKIIINVPSKTLKLSVNDEIVKTYPVGVGISSKFKTPPGIYSIDEKVINPIWEHPYKKPGEVRVKAESSYNPLGKYWIGFHSDQKGSYGIHGTNKEETIGKFVSHGCVRMKNKDIEELFYLLKYQSFVFITYDRYQLYLKENHIFLEIFPDPYKQKKLSKQEITQKIKNNYPRALIDSENLKRALQEQSEKKVYEVGLIESKKETFYY